MLTKDRAVCVRATDYSESSQVVTLFARLSGKVRAIAKGAKRPKSAFDGPIEVLSFGDVVFSNPGKDSLSTLTEFQQQPVCGALRRNLLSLHCALFAAELLDALTDEFDPHLVLFDHFIQLLQDLDNEELTQQRRDMLVRLILFQLLLLQEAGLRPVVKACVNCRRTFSTEWRDVYFSNSANGLICRDCETSFPDRDRLTPAIAGCLADLRQLVQAGEDTLDRIEQVLIHHFTGLLGRRLRMAEYVQKR